jgi:hypothetical protein
MITTSMAALGLIGALALGVPTTAAAQGFYFDGPGVSFGIGAPWGGYGYYGAPYSYGYYGHPYGYYHRPYWRHHYWRGW